MVVILHAIGSLYGGSVFMGSMNEVFDGLLGLEPIEWERTNYYERREKAKSRYPPLLPGNILPRGAPSFDMFVLYEILRGRNIRYSVDRFIRMSTDIADVNSVMREFMKTADSSLDDSLYIQLAKTYAESRGLDFKYESTDYGNVLKMWKTSGKGKNEEYNFAMRRGEHRIQKQRRVDYSRHLKSDKRFLRVSDVGDIRKRALKKLKET